MCLGENSAPHAVHYVNAQLSALWENSVECTRHAGKNLKPLERVRYDFALAEYHVGCKQRSKFTLKQDMMFSAVFDKPRVEFVCNHEAVLYLKIKEGHFNRDFAKTDSSAFVPTRSRNVQLNDVELAFRMDFNINGIRGHTTQIGNGSHLIQLMVLDFHSANLVSKVSVPGAREALSFYIKKYFDFLHNAGHHVLFSLPDFDDDRLQVEVDFSLHPHHVRNLEAEMDEIHGVSLEAINGALSSKWLKAIMDADTSETADHGAICLAEYKSTWTALRDRGDVQFWVKFGAPKLKILCKKEGILCFKIDELLVFDGHDFTVTPKQVYKDWGIAAIVELIKKVNGTTTSVEIDMKNLHICESLCVYPGFEAGLDIAVTLKNSLLEFFEHHYSVILERAKVHIVNIVDSTQSESVTESDHHDHHEGHWVPKDIASTGREIVIKETHTGDYDFLQVISVQNILEQFKALWQSSRESTSEHAKCLVKWAHGDDFKASFGALKIKLLSNDKAMVWIQLDDGHLKPLKGAKDCSFMDWSIAFEVGLALSEHDEVMKKAKSWFGRFKDSFAWKQHGNQESRSLQHLGLDFSTAKFVYEQSKFEGLNLANRSAVECVRGAVHYLTNYYFSELTLHGHHVLYSTPIWKSGSTPPSMGLTGIKFQVYSKHNYSRLNSHLSDAVIVLLGMTKFKPLPKARLEYSTEWVTRSKGQVGTGTICLSRKVFLEERLLGLLSGINATTTIVPIFPGSDDDDDCVALFTGLEASEWGLSLATWGKRNMTRRKRGLKCDWEFNAASGGYKWDYTDKWSYEHEGSHDDANNGIYNVSCQTKNFLELPQSANHGCLDIVMRGEVTIELGFKGATNKWSTKLASKWTTTLSMNSLPGGSGMTFDVHGDSQPKFVAPTTDVAIEKLVNLSALQALLRIDLNALASELRQSFGGVWEHCFPGSGALSLCNPIFNNNGDIIFELRPWVPRSQVPAAKPRVTKKAPPAPVTPAESSPITSTTPKKRGWIKRLVSGVHDVVEDVGEAIHDAFDGDSSDDDSEKKSKSESRRRDESLSASTTLSASSTLSPGSENDAPLVTPGIDTALSEQSITIVEASTVKSEISKSETASIIEKVDTIKVDTPTKAQVTPKPSFSLPLIR